LPFGEDFGETGTQEKRHFTSYERDSENGTDYAINRQYVFSIGRFIQIDPVSGSLKRPQRLNRYAYARNDPMNMRDPIGSEPIYVCTGRMWIETDGDPIEVLTGCEEIDVDSDPDEEDDPSEDDGESGGPTNPANNALKGVDDFFANHRNCLKKFKSAHLIPGGPSLYDEVRSQARTIRGD
jgi:RHS repeat-associated protein